MKEPERDGAPGTGFCWSCLSPKNPVDWRGRPGRGRRSYVPLATARCRVLQIVQSPLSFGLTRRRRILRSTTASQTKRIALRRPNPGPAERFPVMVRGPQLPLRDQDPRRLNSLLNGVSAELQPRASNPRLSDPVAACSPSPVRRRPTRSSIPIGCTVLGTKPKGSAIRHLGAPC